MFCRDIKATVTGTLSNSRMPACLPASHPSRGYAGSQMKAKQLQRRLREGHCPILSRTSHATQLSGLYPQTQPSCKSGQNFPAHLGCGVDIFPAEDTVAEGGGCVVIDELQHLEASHARSLQHSSALRLIEEGWHGDHCVLDGLLYRGQQNRGSHQLIP